jgi:hypothetical protein
VSAYSPKWYKTRPTTNVPHSAAAGIGMVTPATSVLADGAVSPPHQPGQATTYVMAMSGRISSVFWCARWVQLNTRAARLASCSFFSAYTARARLAHERARPGARGRTLRISNPGRLARPANLRALPGGEVDKRHERGADEGEAGASSSTIAEEERFE